MRDVPCPVCRGARLKPEVLAVTLTHRDQGERSIAEVSAMSVAECSQFLDGMLLDARQTMIAGRMLKEVQARLGFLLDVGLHYLSLDRAAGSLSGGEAQRIRLATQIGSGLVGVLYVLDEPSIGLHQRDNRRLIQTLVRLRDLGNTLIVVEHDEDTIRAADWAVDIGPGAGEHGGEIVHSGPVAGLESHDTSLTGAYLSGRRSIPVPGHAAPDRPEAEADDRRGPRAQPARHRRGHPAGLPGRGHRRLRLGQVLADQRHPGHRAGQQAERRPPGARPAHPDHRAGRAGQAGPGRPVADRPHPAVQPGHLHRGVGPGAQAVRGHHRGQGARLPARPVLVQRQGRALRGLLGRRHHQDRDELPAGRLRALRGVQGRPLQPGDPRGALQGQDRGRRAGHADRGGRRVLRPDQLDQPLPAHPGRRRAGLRAARPAGADPVRRRGAARQAGLGTAEALQRTDRSTSSTSRPPGCTSRTSASCCW